MKHIYRKSSFKAKDIKDEIEEKPINFNILKKKATIEDTTQTFANEKEEIQNNYKNAVCQHLISWNNIKNSPREDVNYSNLLYNYVKKFAQKIYDGKNIKYVVCKSCNTVLNNVYEYVADGAFDDNGNFISYYNTRYVQLLEMKEYNIYPKIIEFLDRSIDKICDNLDIAQFVGLNKKREREVKIKEIIDISNFMNYFIKFIQKQENIGYYKNLGIVGSHLITIDLNFIEIDDNSFKSKVFMNIILAYVLILITLDLNIDDIVMIAQDNQININTFNNIKEHLFKNIKIYDNNTAKTKTDILEYQNLCYIIFVISFSILKENMWYSDWSEKQIGSKNVKISKQDHIHLIHTAVDILNHIIHIDTSKLNNLFLQLGIFDDAIKLEMKKVFDILNVKFFSKIKTIYKDKSIEKRIINVYNRTVDIKNKKKTKLDKISKLHPLQSNEYFGHEINRYKSNKYPHLKYTVSRYKLSKPEKMPYIFNENILKCFNPNVSEWNKQSGFFYCNNLKTIGKTIHSPNKDVAMDYLFHYIKQIKHVYCQKLIKRIDTKTLKLITQNCNYKLDKNNMFDFVSQLDKALRIRGVISSKKIIMREMKAKNKSKNTREYILKYIENSTNKKDFIKEFITDMNYELNKKYKLNIDLFKEHYYITENFKGTTLKEHIIIEKDDLKTGSSNDDQIFGAPVLYFIDKINRVYYYFLKKNLKFIGYKEPRKSHVKVDIAKNKLMLNISKSFYKKFKYIGIPLDNLDITLQKLLGKEINIKNNSSEINGFEKKEKTKKELTDEVTHLIYKNIKERYTTFKNYIYTIISNLNIINNNKNISKNDYKYSHLSKYLYDYNLINLKRSRDSDENKSLFYDIDQVFNYIAPDLRQINKNGKEEFKDFSNKVNKLYDLDKNFKGVLFYFIKQINYLISMNPKKRASIYYFVYSVFDEKINEDNPQITYNVSIFKYLLDEFDRENEYFLLDQLGNQDYYLIQEYREQVQDLVTNDYENSDEIKENEDDYLDDNDNDEDDMLRSEYD